MTTNVFADLDLPKPDEQFLRTSLLLELGKLMRESGLTQIELAEKTGIRQPEVSRLLNGKDRGFSTDRLARIAFRLGYFPTIKLERLPTMRAKAKSKASRKAA